MEFFDEVVLESILIQLEEFARVLLLNLEVRAATDVSIDLEIWLLAVT